MLQLKSLALVLSAHPQIEHRMVAELVNAELVGAIDPRNRFDCSVWSVVLGLDVVRQEHI